MIVFVFAKLENLSKGLVALFYVYRKHVVHHVKAVPRQNAVFSTELPN